MRAALGNHRGGAGLAGRGEDGLAPSEAIPALLLAATLYNNAVFSDSQAAAAARAAVRDAEHASDEGRLYVLAYGL